MKSVNDIHIHRNIKHWSVGIIYKLTKCRVITVVLQTVIIWQVVTNEQQSKLEFYVPFNSQGHIGTGPQHCHLWESNPPRGDSL